MIYIVWKNCHEDTRKSNSEIESDRYHIILEPKEALCQGGSKNKLDFEDFLGIKL